MLMWSSFDSKFFEYGRRMYLSFNHFHPDIEMFFGDFGGLSIDEMAILENIGVKMLSRSEDWTPSYLGAVDLLAFEYFEGIEWDRILWIDADTLVLGDLSEAMSCIEDFVGIGPVGPIRPQINDEGDPNFTLGFWHTSSRELLHLFYMMLKNNYRSIKAESPVCTRIINNSGCSKRQLPKPIYGFGRERIVDARYENGVFYNGPGGRVFPKLAHFSRDGITRHVNKELNRWYDEVIEG